MGVLEPVTGEPAAVATLPSARALVIADYHAGYEAALRYERGVDVPSRAADRRERLLALLDRTAADRLIVLGDLMHSIGDPGGAERGELEVLFESIPERVSVTLVKGNHDGAIESWLGGGADEISGADGTTGAGNTGAGNRSTDAVDFHDATETAVPEERSDSTVNNTTTTSTPTDDNPNTSTPTDDNPNTSTPTDDNPNTSTPTDDNPTTSATTNDNASAIDIVSGDGVALGDGTLGICHGHTWPSSTVLASDVICIGHEHPFVRLEDEVGGARVEPVWIRGTATPEPFHDRERYDDVHWLRDLDVSPDESSRPELIVFPAFNDLVGGTWINVPGQEFLAPFLPTGIERGEAYLLDGTRLGPYTTV